jgi:hypothetical protein
MSQFSAGLRMKRGQDDLRADASCASISVLAPPDGAPCWTSELVQAEIGTAYRVISQAGGRPGPAGVKVVWPETRAEWGGHPDPGARLRPGVPEPEAISRAEAAVTWPKVVEDPADRKVLIGRCCGATFRQLSMLDGRSEPTLRKVVRKGLSAIASAVNLRLR